MQQKAIPILSMTARRGDTTTTDGECMDIINVRNENGVNIPTNAPKEISYLNEDSKDGIKDEDYEKVYYHDTAEKYIAVVNGDKKMIRILDSQMAYESSIYLEDSISDINFIGNIMAVSVSDKIIFYLFRKNIPGYDLLGDKPPSSQLNISVSSKLFKHTFNLGTAGVVSSEDQYKAVGVFDACISKGNEEGYYLDRVLVRYAYRLYDGSYFMLSPIYLVEDDIHADTNENNLQFGEYKERADSTPYKVAQAYMFSLNFDVIVDDSLKKWKDIISSIDVFTSNSIYTQKRNMGFIPKRSDESDSTFIIDDKNLEASEKEYYAYDNDLRDKIISESKFYRVASFTLDGKPDIYASGKNKAKDEFSLNDELKDDYSVPHTFYSSNVYVYNSRLHLGNVVQKYFKGYGKDMFKDWISAFPEYDTSSFKTITNVDVYVFIKTTEDEIVVKNTFDSLTLPLARLISYPDSRAYKMTLVYDLDGNTMVREYPLTAHRFLNLAYYLNPMKDGDGVSILDGVSSIPDASDTKVDERPSFEVNDQEIRKNVLKVSKLDNPFFFPNESTYSVSNGSIVGLASIATELSSGQTGDFPLYVFTTKGIYTMKVDTTGKLVYTNVTSLREDVCNNKDSITSALGGVFFTTDQGLMYITGSEVNNITEQIKNNYSINDSIIKQVYAVFGLPELSETMSEYLSLKGLKIAYMYKRDEIIVSSELSDYSYIFNITSKSWYRINKSFSWFINAYPKVYGVKNARVYDIDLIEKDSANDILIISQPMLLESTSFKKVIQSVLRCDLYTNGPVGFYLLGSLDGNKYNLVFTKEIVDKDTGYHAVDMIAKMKRSKSYKYFAFAITGSLYCKSSINTIGLTYDDSMTNRLR